jgi:hypothetical protein
MLLTDIPIEVRVAVFQAKTAEWAGTLNGDERAEILETKLDELASRHTACRSFDHMLEHGDENGWRPSLCGAVDPQDKLVLAIAFDDEMEEQNNHRRVYLCHWEDFVAEYTPLLHRVPRHAEREVLGNFGYGRWSQEGTP